MDSLYTKESRDRFIERIYNLSEKTQPQWGKMNVSQMLTHCQMPLRIADGSLKPKSNLLVKYLFGRSAKKQLINDHEFKRNLPTFSEAKIRDKRVFEEERAKLIALIHNFQEKGSAGLTKDPHPFFRRNERK